MKNMIKLPAIALGLMLLLTGISQKVVAQDNDVSLQTFYDELSPYGTWIQDSQYGYVWRPDVDQGDFRPYYSNGHWAMTEYGNTWVSDYDWGWGPFHYGRWVTDRYNQWLWIPDTTWGPAWVNWRSGGGNYGWAPLGPSINVGFNIPSFWWVFVPQRNIYSNRFSRYDWNRNRVYIRNTTIINNVYVHNRNTYYTGPRRDEIRRVTNRDVRVYSIDRSDRPGRSRISNNTLHMYNPRPDRGTDNRNAAPRNIAERGDIARGNNASRGRDNNTPNRERIGNSGQSDRMERPQSGRDVSGASARPGRGTENRSNAEKRNNNLERPTRERSQPDPQRAQATQQQREQQAQQRGQRDMQGRSQEQTQQREQQRQQVQQQRSQQQSQQRAQMEQQRSQQQTQQREQQRQQVQQQRSQQQAQQRQQMEQQRSQQESQQRSQERQQQMQQRQEMPRAAERVQRMDAPQRSSESRSSGERSGSTGGRSSRGGGRG